MKLIFILTLILAINSFSFGAHQSSCNQVISLVAHNKENYPHVILKNANGHPFNISRIPFSVLANEFDQLAANPKIPFKYPEDGCYARAHKMSLLLDEKGITTGKVFIEGNLRVETPNSPKGYVEWWYHVAPIITVKENGKDVTYVIDPSLFNYPVTVEQWASIQTKHPQGKRDALYFTPRFSYNPGDKTVILSDYRPSDLQDMDDTIQRYLAIIQQRQSGKGRALNTFKNISPKHVGSKMKKVRTPAQDTLLVTRFTDSLRSIDEQTDNYRVTFNLHAAIYYIPKATPQSKQWIAILKKESPVTIESNDLMEIVNVYEN